MVKLTLVFILFALLLLPLLLSLFIKNIPNDIQPSLEGTQIIYKDLTVAQSFISNTANLSGIGMSIKNPYLRNKKSLILNLQKEDRSVVRSVNLNGVNILDGDFMKISFNPIPDSAGKRYYLELLAPDSESQESLEIFMTSKKPSWLKDLYVNGEVKDTALSVVTYHKGTNLLAIPIGIFINWGKRLFEDLPFTAVYLFLIIGMIIFLAGYKSKN